MIKMQKYPKYGGRRQYNYMEMNPLQLLNKSVPQKSFQFAGTLVSYLHFGRYII